VAPRQDQVPRGLPPPAGHRKRIGSAAFCAVEALLHRAEPTQGAVTGHVDGMPFGLLHLDLAPGGPVVPYRLHASGGGFVRDLLLSRVDPLPVAVTDTDRVLRPAIRHADATGAWLELATGTLACRPMSRCGSPVPRRGPPRRVCCP